MQCTAAVSSQEYDPWGVVISGGVGQTAINYTGQRLDATGLLYYHARYYDPSLGKFLTPDSIVPGASIGAGGALGTVGDEQNSILTVDFHEAGFATSLQGENQQILDKGFWFQLSGQDKQQAKEPWGPDNPQALNRYGYVLDNPLRYTDPTGHYLWIHPTRHHGGVLILSKHETQELANRLVWVSAASLTGFVIASILGAVSVFLGNPELAVMFEALAATLRVLGSTAGTLATFLQVVVWTGGTVWVGCQADHSVACAGGPIYQGVLDFMGYHVNLDSIPDGVNDVYDEDTPPYYRGAV